MTQITTHDLWVDGRSIKLTASGVSSTGSMILSWTLPAVPVAYNGAVVIVSERPLTAENFPVDGTRYGASTAWGVPATNGNIGDAQVVAAFYGFFGDNIQQTSVTVDGLDPTKIYYASIHAASNVLQYYTVGSHSYPLEANDPVKAASPFAGSIPKASQPPSNPLDGQIYFDKATNAVLIWMAAQSAWVKATQNAVPVATAPYIDVNQIFVNIGQNTLIIFDGTSWIDADASNLRVKMGATWAPYTNNMQQTATLPETATPGDFIVLLEKAAISSPRVPLLKFYSLGQWFNATPDMVQVFVNGSWSPIAPLSSSNFYGRHTPRVPAIGDFFYNTATQDLMVWTGSAWAKADSSQEGTPSYDKTDVGTDGTSAARLKLIGDVKTRLGYPVVCVELKDQNFDQALNNALAQFRQRADNAYEHRHISFTLIGGQNGGQNVYYLNDPRDRTDKIVNVIKIHRVNQLGISSLSAETGLYAQAFFNQLYQGHNVDVLGIHLMSQLSEVYEKIFAGNISFIWNEASRELTILRRIINAQERVVLEVTMERGEQELINDRWCRMWIQDWTYADCLEQLGLIRTKYGSLPSATGGLSLNGDTLLAKASELKAELLRQILDYEVGNGGVSFGNTTMLIG